MQVVVAAKEGHGALAAMWIHVHVLFCMYCTVDVQQAAVEQQPKTRQTGTSDGSA
jgi:hypothetical protein